TCRFHAIERINVNPMVDASHQTAHLMRGVLDEITATRFKRLGVHPDHAGAKPPCHVRNGESGDDHVSAADIDLVRETDGYRLRRGGGGEIAVISDDSGNTGM